MFTYLVFLRLDVLILISSELGSCNVEILGPGCSSLGFGAFMEHGPFQPGQNGLLLENKYSWNLGEIALSFLIHV